MPLPTFQLKLDDATVDSFLQDLEQFQQPITSGVSVEGAAAAYALVWEWGNVRQVNPGPKTVIGTNPDGRMVWLSVQAPFGYIRHNLPNFVNAIEQHWNEVNLNASNVHRELEIFARKVARDMADLIKMDAPTDSGELRADIRPVYPGDPLLSQPESSDQETLFLEYANE